MSQSKNLPTSLRELASQVDRVLQEQVLADTPAPLREPIAYFLAAPGKKIRPLLTLLSARLVGGKWQEALPAAAAVELFHDFTLIHDDIMDRDELRRGQPTIHIRWDDGTAILSGDALIGLAFRQLLQSPRSALIAVTEMFSEALLRVCEGQALDREFEHRTTVTPEEYLQMIRRKTAWLMRTACGMGAIIGGAAPPQVDRLLAFGELIGLGFQIQDDLLDVIADQQTLGKQVGSDFRMSKKTYVVLKWQQRHRRSGDVELPEDFHQFRQALSQSGVIQEIAREVEAYFQQAREQIEGLGKPEDRQAMLALLEFLRSRDY